MSYISYLSHRSTANGLASRGSDVDLYVNSPALDEMISESKNETMLHTRIGNIIRELGSMLRKNSKYFIEFNRIST
jgi:DNA polymerase sigma